MTVQDVWAFVHGHVWQVSGVAAALVVLIPSVVWVVTRHRPDRWVNVLATVVGLGWSAQGMWTAAVHRYDVPVVLASVLFFLFEALLIGQMFRAHRVRADRRRRAPYVRAVWLIACVMGAVVALAEGWSQAPLRIAVPLLVAYEWWLGLTADDDPDTALSTSWRWTPRRVGLALGMLEPGERDAHTIDRDRHVRRMTSIAFRRRYDHPTVSALLRRPTRLARLALAGDDAMVADMRARLARADRVMTDAPEPGPVNPPERETHPVPVPQENPPEIVQPAKRPAERKPDGDLTIPFGAVLIGGELVRGSDVQGAVRDVWLRSIHPDRPRGVGAPELVQAVPGLKDRRAEGWVAEWRKALPVNGSAVR